LFDVAEISIERGEQVLRTRRDPKLGRYDYSEGRQAGRLAQLV
jgi:hypothetical protein